MPCCLAGSMDPRSRSTWSARPLSDVIATATRVLRLRFAPEREATEERIDDTLIDFVAYGHETLLAGTIHLDADRLTDLLNGTDELELLDVVSLGPDGSVVDLDRAAISRSELVAVKAGEPRGRPVLRRRTRQTAVVAGSGRYVVHGYLHTRPGADAMIDLGRRPPMIPLTDAMIVYEVTDRPRRDHASTLILNRDVADWMRLARPDELARLLSTQGAA